MLFAAWPFTTDDAYISLRYARHLAEGNGIVWNLGERPLEGYSNFLFVLIGTAAFLIKIDPVLVLKSAGVLGLVCSLWLTYRLARFWLGPLSAALPCMLLPIHPGFVWWAVSGLETSVFLALSLAALVTLFYGTERIEAQEEWRRRSACRYAAIAGTLVFIASLTRPEGPLLFAAMSAPLVPAMIMRRRSPLGRFLLQFGVVFGAAFLLPYLGYVAWKITYFERLLPNSVYCKGMLGTTPGAIVLDFARRAWPLVLLALLHFRASFKLKEQTIATLSLLYLAALIDVDRVLSYLGRYTLIVYVLLSVPAVAAALNIVRRVSGRRGEIVACFVAALFTTPVLLKEADQLDTRRFVARSYARTELARWLSTHLSASDAYVIGDAGLVPYLAPRKVFDAYCLNSSEITGFVGDRSAKFIQFILNEAPEVIVVHSYSNRHMDPHTLYDLWPRLINEHNFTENYVHVETFGAIDDICQYWVFRRRS